MNPAHYPPDWRTRTIVVLCHDDRMVTRRVTSVVVALAVGAGLAAGPALGGADLSVTRGAQKYTPVIHEVQAQPRWFRGDDGRIHLQYEILLTNASPLAVEVNSVEVLDGGGHLVRRLSGNALESAMGWAGNTTTGMLEPRTVAPVWIDLTFRKRSSLPTRVKQRLTVSLPEGLPVGPKITDTSKSVEVAPTAARVIAPPLRGKRWVAVVGAHRRALQPVNGRLELAQRFAIDFSAQLDRRGFSGRGDSSRNSSYFAYGQPLLAVGDGKVVAAVDRYPDQIPNAAEPVSLAAADGNHVIIRLARGVYAAYAHIKPGTVRVRPGQRIKAGQILGRLGNSGATTGPHLHFQLMSRPSLLDADGLPFVVDRFRFDGRAPSLEEFIDADREGTPVAFDRSRAGDRRDQGFTGLEVVSFR